MVIHLHGFHRGTAGPIVFQLHIGSSRPPHKDGSFQSYVHYGDFKRPRNLMVKNIFTKHDIPDCIVSDRGAKFVNKFWQRVCSSLAIDRILSTAYHPETDGQTERINSVLSSTFVFTSTRRLVALSQNSSTTMATTLLPVPRPFRELRIPSHFRNQRWNWRLSSRHTFH